MEIIRAKVEKIVDSNMINDIEKLLALVELIAPELKKDDNVLFVHKFELSAMMFLDIDTLVFIKRDTSWYGVRIAGCCLSPIKVKWGEDKVIVDCEADDGEVTRLHLTLD